MALLAGPGALQTRRTRGRQTGESDGFEGKRLDGAWRMWILVIKEQGTPAE